MAGYGLLEAVLVTDGGQDIDLVDYSTWTVPTGASLELASDRLDAADNDLPGAWCPAQADLGSGDLGTPGVIAPPCP